MLENSDCVFCGIVKGDIQSDKVYEDERMLVFKDINPAADVHLICIPKTHYRDLEEFCEKDIAHASKFVKKMTKIGSEHGVDGEYKTIFNTGKSVGQTVFHVHGHILSGNKVEGGEV